MAAFDLPAMIDYVLKTSQQAQLSYVGHSQGTLIGFAGFSSNPQLAKKLNLFVALAPIYFLNNISAFYRDLAYALFPIEVSWDTLSVSDYSRAQARTSRKQI